MTQAARDLSGLARPDRSEGRAKADVAAYRANPACIGSLPLGRFSDASVRSLLLRRMLLKLPRPVVTAAARILGRLWPKAPARPAEVAYWRTVKSLLARDEWRRLTHGPVILMYHAIGREGERTSRYVTSAVQFRRHAAWLRRRGYDLITLREVAQAHEKGALLPPRSVAVTFDDGYRDNLPALAETGIPATVFVVTGSVGGGNEWDAAGELRGRSLLTWDDARRLVSRGVEIGGHTRTHPTLPDLRPEALQEELAGSLGDLQRELGAGPYTFAYPHGRFDPAVEEAVQAAGFAAAACSRGGVNDPYIPQYELRRVEIKGTDSFFSYILMVELGRRITPGQFLRSLVFGSA